MRKEFRVEKQRHEVAIQRFAIPLRDAAPRALEEFWGLRHTYDRAANAEWRDKGPSNFSGRATCLVVHPNEPKLLYAGSAAGGLWKSEDAGERWTSCWPNALSQNIGAVAIDPASPSRILCATGEGNLSTASYPGSGIYASDDGGFSWTSFIFIPGRRRMTSQDRDTMPRRVSGISFGKSSTFGDQLIALASISNDEQLPGGLYSNLAEPGQGMKFVTKWSKRPYKCYSVAFDPRDPEQLYATIDAGGAVNGIWRSTKHGNDWERFSEGLPSGELCGRISLAISTKDPSVMWALVASRRSRLLGVFRYNQATKRWEDTAGPQFRNESQLSFNNTIAIHPEDPRIVFCGVQNLYRTTNGGASWLPISNPDRAITSRKRNSRYAHADHHAIVMPGGNVVYSANDGGISKSTDLGATWNDSSRGMSTVMFYAIEVSPARGDIYGGGAQDNGTLMAGVNPGKGLPRRNRSSNRRDFIQVLDGDGGYLVCDHKKPELVFASTFDTRTRCHDPGTPWSNGLLFGDWRNASPKVFKNERDVLGLTVMAIRPPGKGQPREVILGTNRLWRTADDGRTWTPSRFQFDGSAVTAIEVASADPSVMFVGTAKGGIYRSDDGGHEWSADLAGPEIPNRVITQVETHPTDCKTVVVTVASTGREAASLTGRPAPYSHVFRSIDSGRFWDDIDKGGLPNVVFNGLAYETRPPYRIFAAGDAGPWVHCEDGRWASIAGDMPSAVISDIIYHHKTRTLTAGTYGRGIWRMKVPRKFQILKAQRGIDANALLPPIEGFVLDQHAPVPQPLTPAEGSIFPPRSLQSFACGKMRDVEGYVFETSDPFHVFHAKASRTPAVEMSLSFAGDYTWRCWALYCGGRCSFPSNPIRFACG
jgi:photosystem II stability/assembly factor-like uncharacterized protein